MAQKPSAGSGRSRFSLSHEAALRSKFEGSSSPLDSERGRAVEMQVEAIASAQIERNRLRYLEGANPVLVWDTILLLGSLGEKRGQPPVLPSWVAAYLVSAATDIMGRAVVYPDGNRQKPKPASRTADGKRIRYSSYFAGLTAAQRRDIVLEALGFKGSKGWNPIAQAHRDIQREDALRAVDRHRAAGARTIRGAIVRAKREHPQLQHVDDPARKIRRDRRRQT